MMSDATIPSACAFPDVAAPGNPSVFWILADASPEVQVLEKKLGCKLTSATFHCGCSKKTMLMDNVGKYLEESHVCGIFEKLVLVGSPEAIRQLRTKLSTDIQGLVVGEIIQS